MPTSTVEKDADAPAPLNITTQRRGKSWQFLLTSALLAVQIVASSASNTAIDYSSKAIWDAIDQEDISSLRKPPILSLNQETEKSSQRSLRSRPRERFRKDRSVADYHLPATTEERHRLLITCDETKSQEDCLSKLLKAYDKPKGKKGRKDNQRPIEVVHNLEMVHALSIDVDTDTLEKLVTDGKFAVEMDFARGPLVLEGSMSYYQPSSNEDGHRNLEDSQEIPWGLSAIGAQDVWEQYGVKGEGVKICVLDSGVQASHEDFRQTKFDGYYGNEFVSPYWYEDFKGHGTHITGIIAASDNTIGIV